MMRDILSEESGATAIEYSLMAALIAMVIIGAVSAVGTGVKDSFFDRVANNL
jgi:pilus assembly protein Flp/PilA